MDDRRGQPPKLGKIESYPAGSFMTGLIAAALVLAWLSINPYLSYVHMRKITERNNRIAELCGIILRLDEVLTDSARMAAATGAPEWEKRYRTFDPVLFAAISEAAALTEDARIRRHIEDTEAANRVLVDIESRSFRLTRQGRLKQAWDLLFGPEYLKQKRIYADGLGRFVAGLRRETREHLRQQERRTLLKSLVPLIAVAALLFAWLKILSLLAAWRKYAEFRNAELARLNAALDRKVDEQGRALATKDEQLLQAQKLESIGRLAGGIAHDFNNILTAVIGFAGFLKRGISSGRCKQEDVEQIIRAAKKAAGLTQQLLAFSRRQVLEPKVLDLNVLVENIEKMLQRVIGEDVSLETCLAPAQCRVKVDPGQIDQVILNLAVNARDAMPNGGKLTLETALVALDEAYAEEHPGVKPGRYAMLAVSDTGAGMDDVVQKRIFEPFFTTKQPGKGTGLGLSTVYGIIKQSEGHVSVYSEVGRGTTFKVYLPITVEADAEREARQAEPPKRGVETILLVEDEPMVRAVARRLLLDNGYVVLEASSGEDALGVAREHAAPVHLLVSDLVMPGIDGVELANRLSAFQPETKILLMSGYTDKAVNRQECFSPGTHYLQKPFTPDAFARNVRAALDAPRC